MRFIMTRQGALLVALAALISACGGDGGGADTTSDGDTEGPAEITVVTTDFAFDPSTVSVATGPEITVTVENQGTVEHDWVVLDQGREISAETDLPEDTAEVNQEWAVAAVHTEPGEAATTTFTAPAAGTYQIICVIPGHFSAGMEGELTVTDG
ncbi:MAG: plastocyanin/azurin family copper-binding protein [Actinomycetota bacterium]|nr:plastocyanin/azurin family copper-binding protein [Actinomycetota bacterium]